MTDDGSILFPSITICKDEMFDNVTYSERGLLTRLQSGEVSAENASSWFLNRTFSRARLVKFLSIKTVTGSDSNNYPCNAVSGPKARYIRASHWSSPYINTALSLVQKLEIFSQCSPIVHCGIFSLVLYGVRIVGFHARKGSIISPDISPPRREIPAPFLSSILTASCRRRLPAVS